MNDALEKLIGGLRAARDNGIVTREEAARTLGEILLDSAHRTDAQQPWRVTLDSDLVRAALVALDGGAATSAGSGSRSDTDRLLAHIADRLGDPNGWAAPTRYESVALAAIDSIWSIGVRYTGVLNVLSRYRALRNGEEADADRDTPTDLIGAIGRSGGPDGFADQMSNHQRTSSSSGILKAEAVLRAAETLRDAQLANPGDIHGAPAARLDSFRAAWRLIPGQRSGLSLDYFLMLCGMPGVKGDRMIRRFVAAALGEPNELAVDPARAVSLVQLAAFRLGTDDRTVDFAIWQYESRQAGRTRGAS
jgi:hypothetical protein